MGHYIELIFVFILGITAGVTFHAVIKDKVSQFIKEKFGK